MDVFIGCSGYYYNHWKNVIYPDDLPKSKWLIHYSGYFNTVELNNTFYRMPEEKSVKNWYAITPSGFRFAVKGYRFITHMKKLSVDNMLKSFLDSFLMTVSHFGEKLGPVLWQLPGNFPANNDKLERFCSLLSNDFSHVFEFRHESWFTESTYQILASHNHGLCIVSAPDTVPEIIRLTSGFAYIRFHGKGAWYSDNYSQDELISWKKKIDSMKAGQLFAYFNNDVNGYAVNNGRFFASLF